MPNHIRDFHWDIEVIIDFKKFGDSKHFIRRDLTTEDLNEFINYYKEMSCENIEVIFNVRGVTH